MKTALNLTLLLLVLALSNSGIGRAAVADNIYWYSSDTSNVLNRSSVELATGHIERGIYFAHKALEKNLSRADTMIANHNLCIGYLLMENTSMATRFCARAFFLSLGPYEVVNKHGALRLKETEYYKESQSKMSPVEVLVSNMQQQYPDNSLAGLMN